LRGVPAIQCMPVPGNATVPPTARCNVLT
jgi:hypothetical protein